MIVLAVALLVLVATAWATPTTSTTGTTILTAAKTAPTFTHVATIAPTKTTATMTATPNAAIVDTSSGTAVAQSEVAPDTRKSVADKYRMKVVAHDADIGGGLGSVAKA